MAHRHQWFLLCPFVVLLYVILLRAQTPPQSVSLSPAASDAIIERDKACQAADEIWKKATLAANERLVEKLKRQMNAATKSGDLDLANSIKAEMKLATDKMNVIGPLPSGVTAITRATLVPLGKEASSTDVTEMVRPCVSNGSLIVKGLKFKDPAPNFHKVLVVEGTLQGMPFRMTIPEESYVDGLVGVSLDRGLSK